MARELHPGEELERENRAVLSHYHTLQSSFAAIMKEGKSEGTTVAELIRKLEAIEQHINQVGSYLSVQINPKFYNEIKSEGCTVASRVLHIPELLELALSFGDAHDLVAMEQVNKTARDVISGSPKLQLIQGDKPEVELEDWNQYEDDYSSIFEQTTMPGLEVKTGRGVRATFHRLLGRNALPKIGSKYLKMLISEPPISDVDVYNECPSCGVHILMRGYRIESKSGITVGDIYKQAERVIDMEIQCGFCDQASLLNESSNLPTRATSAVIFEYGTLEW